jgi:hypothetical protein
VRSGVPAGNLFPIGVTLVTWTATDYFGNQTVRTQKITILDGERPTLSVPPALTKTVSSSQSSIFVSDAELGTASASDNSGSVTITRTGVPAGNLFPVGTTTITYTATDASGNTTTLTQRITVKGPPIAVSAPGSQSATEGTAKTFNLGSFTGGAGSWTVTVDWGDGTTSTFGVAGPAALSAAHAFANDRPTPYTVRVTVSDTGGNSGTGTFAVSVANAAPRVTINSPAAGASFGTNSTVQVSASFTDAGSADTHTCTINWGDGRSTAGTVSESGGSGTCTAANTYKNSGTYTILVTITDNAGAAASSSAAISVTKANGNGGNATVFSFRTTAGSAPKAKQQKQKQAAPKRLRGLSRGPSRLAAQ